MWGSSNGDSSKGDILGGESSHGRVISWGGGIILKGWGGMLVDIGVI